MRQKELSLIINHLLDKPTRLYQKFHLGTKIKKIVNTGTIHANAWKDISYKTYPRLPQLFLPSAHSLSSPLGTILQNRTSQRLFSTTPLSLDTLSTLLKYTCGIKDNTKHNRFYPSAGARYPLEAYIIAINTDIPKGLYHYNVKAHALERLMELPTFSPSEYFIGGSEVTKAGCIMILTAVFERTTIKYGERGYRHVLQEAGALTQTAYVVATALSVAICALGGYKDDALHELLDIDGTHEAVVGTLILGNMSTRPR